MRGLVIAVGAAAVFASAAWAQAPEIVAGPADLKWGPAPPGLPKGAQAAVLAGDPTKDTEFVIRAKLPAGYKIPPHYHSTAETVTILSGSFRAGMGDSMDAGSPVSLQPGGFVAVPAKMHHYASAGSETVIQIQAKGPFDITYINPADDPRKAQ